MILESVINAPSSVTETLFGHGHKALQGYEFTGYYGGTSVSDPGSTYALILYDSGYAKVLFFLLVQIIIISTNLRDCRNSRLAIQTRLASAVIACFFVVHLVLSMFEVMFNDILIGFYLWTSVGILYGLKVQGMMNHDFEVLASRVV